MSSYSQPDATGHFGIYGGSFVSETLTHAISELRDAYAQYQNDPEFRREFEYELKHFVGRPSPGSACPSRRRCWAGSGNAGRSSTTRTATTAG